MDSNFKPNVFQKILIIFYIVLISFIGIFFVPFRIYVNSRGDNYYRTVYDAIWSSNGNIDLYRIFIYLIVLTVVFFFTFKLLGSMNDLEPDNYKKKAKIELYVLLLFLISIPCSFLFLLSANYINESAKIKIENNIQEIDSLILTKTQKKDDRLRFWNLSSNTFNDMYIYDNNIENYWSFMHNELTNQKWFDDFYRAFNKRDLNNIGISSQEQLALFVINHKLNEKDKINEKDIIDLNSEKIKLKFRQAETKLYDIKISFFYIIISIFVVLYLLRPFLMFIKGMFYDLNNEV